MADKSEQEMKTLVSERDEIERLLEELGVSEDSTKDEYKEKIDSFNKLTLWQGMLTKHFAHNNAS